MQTLKQVQMLELTQGNPEFLMSVMTRSHIKGFVQLSLYQNFLNFFSQVEYFWEKVLRSPGGCFWSASSCRESCTRIKPKKSPVLHHTKWGLELCIVQSSGKYIEKWVSLCMLNFIATKALLCCDLAKSHWSKVVCLWLQAECLSLDDELSAASAEIIKPSNVKMNARENRFQNGQHKKSSQILSNQVLDIENVTLANPASYVSLPSLPDFEGRAWDFGVHPSKELVHL